MTECVDFELKKWWKYQQKLYGASELGRVALRVGSRTGTVQCKMLDKDSTHCDAHTNTLLLHYISVIHSATIRN